MVLKGSQFFWTQLAMMGQIAYYSAETGRHLSSTGREMQPVRIDDEKLYFFILNGEIRAAQTRNTLNREFEGSNHEVAIEKVR